MIRFAWIAVIGCSTPALTDEQASNVTVPCTSWDLHTVGDDLGFTFRAPFTQSSPTWSYTCTTMYGATTCSGTPESSTQCQLGANNLAAQLRTQIGSPPNPPNPPAAALSALAVVGSFQEVSYSDTFTGKIEHETYRWRCNYTISNYADPLSGTGWCSAGPCTPTPVSFTAGSNHGTYSPVCGPNGFYGGVGIDWLDGAAYHHTASVTGDIFQAWVRNNANTSGSVEAAMAGTQSSINGWPVLGMPFESPVCRDASCKQIDQTFDQGFVFDNNHQLSFTKDYRDTLTYFDVRATTYHNTYAHNEPLWDLLTYYHLRSIELDFRASKRIANDRYYNSIPGDWFVYHYQGVSSDEDSRCFRMSDCLREVKAWHDVNPYHEVITIFGDAGNTSPFASNPAWDDGHRPEDFDARITSDLAGTAPDGKPILFTPARLIEWCKAKPGAHLIPTTIKEAVAYCGWPTLKELRGHILWVITTRSGNPAFGVNRYLDSSQNGGHPPSEMAAFGIEEAAPDDAGNTTTDTVFFNIGSCGSWSDFNTECANAVGQPERDGVTAAHDNAVYRFITRLYSNDDVTNFNLARRNSRTQTDIAPANFIATHHATQGGFRTTPSNGRGFPFECIDSLDKPMAECATHNWIETTAPAIRMVGSSGAMTVPSELARLEQIAMPASSRSVWTAGIIGDRLDHPGVEGCIEARHSSVFDDAFIAICRDNQSSEVTTSSAHVYSRTTQGGPIDVRQLSIDDGHQPGADGYGLEQQHAVYMKLSIYRDASLQTHALVYTSRDGVHWGCNDGECDYSVDFPASMQGGLSFQGLSMSTNDQGIFELFFLNPHVRSYVGATSFYDPGDGTLTMDRAVTAGELVTGAGNGVLGDLGNGLGAY